MRGTTQRIGTLCIGLFVVAAFAGCGVQSIPQAVNHVEATVA